tara:strand:+ start:676 stop:2706 length:2031 start_codon:yes stop_codon:yes gene_type:complete
MPQYQKIAKKILKLSNSKEPILNAKEIDESKGELAAQLMSMFRGLDGNTQIRLNAYKTYDRFFNGEQWFRYDQRHKRSRARHRETFNICRPTVEKFQALLMGTPPEKVIPRTEENEARTDAEPESDKEFPQEFNRSELLEKTIRKVYFKDNTMKYDLKEGAKSGSLYGDTLFYHPWDEDRKTVVLESIFPGYFRFKFKSNRWQSIDYGFKASMESLSSIFDEYDFEAAGNMPGDINADTIWNRELLNQSSGRGYGLVVKFWDDHFKIVIIDSTVVSIELHGNPRIPFTLIPNLVNPFKPYGNSDLSDVVGLDSPDNSIQESLNEALSDEADIVQIFANPKIVAKGLSNKVVDALKTMTGNVINLGTRKEAELRPFEFRSQIFPVQARIQTILDMYHRVSGLPAIAFGSAQGSIVTGVALTAQFAPTLQIIRDKIGLWDEGLASMDKFILMCLEEKGGKVPGTELSYADVIDGNYEVENQWESRLPRDDSIFINNELQKLQARVQSRTLTMTKLGIRSPEDELQLIAYEDAHPLLNPDKEKQAVVDQNQNQQDMQVYTQSAQEDIQELSAGETPEPKAIDVTEHQVHIQLETQFVQQNKANMSEEMIKAFDKHIAGHEKGMQEASTRKVTEKKPKREIKKSKAGGTAVGAGAVAGQQQSNLTPGAGATPVPGGETPA